MPKRLRFPRNEASRRDKIISTEIFNAATRNHKSRNDAVAQSPYPTAGADVVLTGTAITSGVTEEMMVDGSETLIITLSGDVWHADIGADNSITDALIAGFSTAEAEAAGFIAQIIGGDGALAAADIARTSDTVVTVTFPASASFALAADEVVTLDIPGVCTGKGIDPVSDSFTLSANVSITLGGSVITGGVLESEVVTGSETLTITISGDTWVATIGADNGITTAFLSLFSGGASFNSEVRDAADFNDLARTSDTVLTFTLPAAAAYTISADDIVTLVIGSSSHTNAIGIKSKAFTITNEA